ncbi:endonuclease III domain-containing protein [Methanobrevibacter filiformis]|uniref:Endonuclease III n=1 Tax=Methanobrevibacter filiformis TaxID=55758 RepID=A0A166BLE6_9EURY|nr:endonuclease III [Methanobrevibacter filiformis]KZX13522.1 ultraviolet N-glycosylase/AP lyase [Methanobrevibacter filiformis]
MEQLNEIYTLRVFEDRNPYRVLIRTILSQRTRDNNTDQATKNLFLKYKDIYEVADAPIEELEKLVKVAGFYRVKARRVKEVSNLLIDQFGGEVPNNSKELLELPGVGQKTANCVLVFAFQKPAIPVDTHVHRISNLWGIVNTMQPEKTEEELMKIVPKKLWIELNDLMVQFGQTICKPIYKQCEQCPLTELCDYYLTQYENKNE